VRRADAQVRGVIAAARAFELRAQDVGEVRGLGVYPLDQLTEHVQGAVEGAASLELVELAGELQQAVGAGIVHFLPHSGDVLVEFAACLHHQLGGSGRSRSANIGDKIGNGEIAFMAHAGDDGDGAGGNGARDLFLVKGPQILERTAATRENEDVDKLVPIEVLDGAHDLAGCPFALHAHRIKREVHIVEATAQDADDVG